MGNKCPYFSSTISDVRAQGGWCLVKFIKFYKTNRIVFPARFFSSSLLIFSFDNFNKKLANVNLNLKAKSAEKQRFLSLKGGQTRVRQFSF